MGQIVLVGIGGFIGSILRYLMSGWVYRILDNPWFPYGTLAVNVLGCLLIGLLAGLAENRSFFTSETRVLVFIGILGGFTTFSAFAYETLSLAKNAQNLAALINILLEVVLGLVSAWIGNALARLY
jgi:CrcB protein